MAQLGTLRKRGNTWELSYFDASGKRVFESAGANERQARKLLRERVEAVEDAKALEKAERACGTYRERSGQTFGEYLATGLTGRSRGSLAAPSRRTGATRIGS